MNFCSLYDFSIAAAQDIKNKRIVRISIKPKGVRMTLPNVSSVSVEFEFSLYKLSVILEKTELF
jgi:hypothetical protein